jgi:hypothetical protein
MMAKAKLSIEEMIAKADDQAALVATGELDPLAPPTTNGQPDDVAPGMMRIHIVSTDHTDGKAKKTWLRDSVIEIDQYTAQRMIQNLKCAYPTTEPINEILAPYKGK